MSVPLHLHATVVDVVICMVYGHTYIYYRHLHPSKDINRTKKVAHQRLHYFGF